MGKILKRHEVSEASTWKTSDLFESKEAFMDSLEKLKSKTKDFLNYKGRLNESASVFYDALVKIEGIVVELIALGTYAELEQSTDASNVEIQELYMAYLSAETEISTDLTFFKNEFLSLPEGVFRAYFQEEPKLEVYRKYLEGIYEEKDYKLDDETEEVLAALGEVIHAPYNIYSISKASDMVFDDIEDGKGKVHPNSFNLFEGKYEFSEDPVLRKNAYDSFNKTLKKYKNTYASVYASQVKKEVTMAKLRGYKSVTQMLLKSQEVTEEMYHRQIDVIYKSLAPHMRRFAGLLKKELKLEKINFYDLKAPIDKTYNPSATYDEAKETVLKSLAVMGHEYVEIINKAFDERWIDYADNAGKSSGAFCASPYSAHPYILVTFQDNMRDAFTLTHELGHAGHFYLANKNQKYFNTEPSTYTVEAPSTMNEMLLGRYLLKNNSDPQMKKWVILQFMGTYYHNFVTHLLEAAFQRKIYDFAEKGKALTSQLLCDTKLEVLRGFWGDAVDIDEAAGMTWMRQPHYYMGLYPYTYSAGLTASTACSEMIFEEGQAAVDRWLEMLKMGGKLKPLDLLKVAGMDFTTDEPVEKAVAYVGSLIDQLIELCD